MGIKFKTFKAKLEYFMEQQSVHYVLNVMSTAEVADFSWPADDVDPDIKHVNMSVKEAEGFLGSVRAEIQAEIDRVAQEHRARDKSAERKHQIALARIQAQPIATKAAPPATDATPAVGECDPVEARKLDLTLALWDSCRKDGHIGCANEEVRKFLCRDLKHEFIRFGELRKKAFDGLSTAEQQLLMSPAFSVASLPAAAQEWLRIAYAGKCYHLEYLYIQAEIYKATKHAVSIPSIKDTIETRKPRFEKEKR